MIPFRSFHSIMSSDLQCSCDISSNNLMKCDRGTDMRPMLADWLRYFKTRRWGLQMLIRMTLSEKVFFRHLIAFCVGLILSLSLCDYFMSDTRAFIEFRTNILRKVNFTNFDNERGSDKPVIPNYIHYIRLEQPEIR